MASPQKEKGFVPIANELMEALSAVQMSGSEWQVLMCILRKTYGFNKKEDWITNSQIVALTGLRKERVSEAKKRLIQRNIVTEKRNKLSLQKDYEKWKSLRKNVTIVTEKRNSLLRKSVHTKDTITKDIYIGETSSPKSDKKVKDMGNWNRTGDDFEEGFVDYDDDGSLKQEKLKPTRKYPNAPAVRKVFLEVLGRNPLDWNKNKVQLTSCENLFEERGLVAIKNALEWYKENREKEFCPQINSPHDLDSKWTKLATFKRKNS